MLATQVHTWNVRWQMRYGALVVLASGLVLVACDGTAVRSDAAGAAPPPPMALELQCEIADAPDPDRCTNLLAAGWDTMPVTDALVASIRKMVPEVGADTVWQRRSVAADCRRGQPPKSDVMPVGYRVPAAAMAVFPNSGTKGRHLVTAIIYDSTNSPCWSARYSIQRKMGGKDRLISFLTVTTDSGGRIEGVDRQVGKWKAWTIRSKDAGLELVNTAVGAWVACGHRHFEGGRETHAFINCKTAAQIALAAEASVSKPANATKRGPDESLLAAAFDRLLIAYRKGEKISGVVGDQITDSAWSRCGNLGCCAAE